MKISEYIKKYTDGNKIYFFGKRGVMTELGEFLHEVRKFNKKGMHEEWEDFLHFMQLWLYWRFGLNQEVWKCTQDSVNKFIERLRVWNKIYTYCGLPEDISGYVGNYNRPEKVVNHLNKYGIKKSTALDAYKKVVLGGNT